jgi:hypothetical protein
LFKRIFLLLFCTHFKKQKTTPQQNYPLESMMNWYFSCIVPNIKRKVHFIELLRTENTCQGRDSDPCTNVDINIFPDDVWLNIVLYLDGPFISLLQRINRRFFSLMKNPLIWKTASKTLKLFVEDPSKTIVVPVPSSWEAVYWALRRESISFEASEVIPMKYIPVCSELLVSSHGIEYRGPIGGDRAVRAPIGWTIPPAAKSRSPIFRGFGARTVWKVPPLLVACHNEPASAEYIFAPCRYFEVSVLDPRGARPSGRGESSWCVAVGLSADDFPLEGMQPGWDIRSCAYHSDDGHVFFGNARLASLPPFGPGDIVGCGLRSDRRLFFTLNGRLLATMPALPPAFCERARRGGLFPTVGVDTPCPLRVNCGCAPFMYDLRDLRAGARGCGGGGGGGWADGWFDAPSSSRRSGRGRLVGALHDCGCSVS